MATSTPRGRGICRRSGRSIAIWRGGMAWPTRRLACWPRPRQGRPSPKRSPQPAPRSVAEGRGAKAPMTFVRRPGIRRSSPFSTAAACGLRKPWRWMCAIVRPRGVPSAWSARARRSGWFPVLSRHSHNDGGLDGGPIQRLATRWAPLFYRSAGWQAVETPGWRSGTMRGLSPPRRVAGICDAACVAPLLRDPFAGRAGRICARSRNCWAMPAFRRRSATRRWMRPGCLRCSGPRIRTPNGTILQNAGFGPPARLWCGTGTRAGRPTRRANVCAEQLQQIQEDPAAFSPQARFTRMA